MSKKILITKGSGQLGGKIANLAKGRYEVLVIFDEYPIGLRNVQALKLDITDRRKVRDFIEEISLFDHALRDKEFSLYGDDLNVRDWLYTNDNCIGIALVLRRGSEIKELGYEQTYDFEATMKETIEWYKQNEWWWNPLVNLDKH